MSERSVGLHVQLAFIGNTSLRGHMPTLAVLLSCPLYDVVVVVHAVGKQPLCDSGFRVLEGLVPVWLLPAVDIGVLAGPRPHDNVFHW